MEGRPRVEEKGATAGPHDRERLQRALGLFRFLARVQQITPDREPAEPSGHGARLVWLHSLPEGPAVHAPHRDGVPTPGDPILTIERREPLPPPEPPTAVLAALATGFGDPARPPSLTGGPDGRTAVAQVEIDPSTVAAYGRWMAVWSQWATNELRLEPVRDAYRALLSIRSAADEQDDAMELLCGVGCLGWEVKGRPVLAHTFVLRVTIDVDTESGRLTVRPTPTTETLRLELDMIDIEAPQSDARVNEIRQSAHALTAHPLDRGVMAALGRQLLRCLHGEGRYLDDEFPPETLASPALAFAPALILRPRSQASLVQAFRAIVRQMDELGRLPEGLVPLVDGRHDPDPTLLSRGDDGALVAVGDDVQFPFPLDDAQVQLLRRVDSSAQVLAEWPHDAPRTVTSAALVTHLLAQGKRVLVTARADGALRGIRAELPRGVLPLAVEVVDAERCEGAALADAVTGMAATVGTFDPPGTESAIVGHLSAIESLGEQRRLLSILRDEARDRAARQILLPHRLGMLASIAEVYEALRPAHGWIHTMTYLAPDAVAPLCNAEILELRRLLAEQAQPDGRPSDQRQELIAESSLMSPDEFEQLVLAEHGLWRQNEASGDVPMAAALSRVPGPWLDQLAIRFGGIVDEAALLTRVPMSWVGRVLPDAQRRQAAPWWERRNHLAGLLAAVVASDMALGVGVQDQVDPRSLLPAAEALRNFLAKGGQVTLDAGGRPVVRGFANRAVRQAEPLLAAVTIDGGPPTTVAMLDHFLAWARVEEILRELDQSWPEPFAAPPSGDQNQRLQWHMAGLGVLDRILVLATRIDELEAILAELRGGVLDWSDLGELRRILGLIECRRELWSLWEAVHRVEEPIAAAVALPHIAPCVVELHRAVRARDVDGYRTSMHRLHDLLERRAHTDRADHLASRLGRHAPMLAAKLREEPGDPRWDRWLPEFEEAWQWGVVGSWLADQQPLDAELLQGQLDAIDEEIRGHVGAVSVARAWLHVMAPARMTETARADLERGAAASGSPGGDAAGDQVVGGGMARAPGARKALDRSRPLVPVWIMPIYRIAEQRQLGPEIFDVVVVDELPRNSLEWTMLQYIAPKLVVIRDGAESATAPRAS